MGHQELVSQQNITHWSHMEDMEWSSSNRWARLQILIIVLVAHWSEFVWNSQLDLKFLRSSLGSGQFFFNWKATSPISLILVFFWGAKAKKL
jgi:hypothetical protein